MERSVVHAPAAAVRDAIACAVLGHTRSATTIGMVRLRPHQQSAVTRLRAVMHEFGGALLADDAGLGKTYVAAAIASDASQPLIVAPASLRAMWADALHATGVHAELTSYSSLSRGGGPRGPFDLLVLDEAHHARTPTTRRYARLAELSHSARVLLLSATPIHNTHRDLGALFALFLGARAWTMDAAELARCIVRRERHDVRDSAPLPDATPPRWLHVGADDDFLHTLLALPPPVPPSDGGDGGALLVWSLVRQWASSQGALAAALRRRLARAAALTAALESGRYPSRSELAAWTFTGDAVQLAFPELVASTASAQAGDLLNTVHTHERAVRALLDTMHNSPDLDATRAAHLLALRAAHAGEKIVAFTQYAETVRALYDRLRRTPGVAALTASGARVAGGTLTRREAIARFAPRAAHAAPPPAVERIDLLLATDVLSEGLNLQDASVVVHLDLPWTPARLEQRVGRSRRIGARHARTSVYAFAPPAAAESLMRVEARLREKMHIAGRVVGMADGILPLAADLDNTTIEHERDNQRGTFSLDTSAARTIELIHQTLTDWRVAHATPEHVNTNEPRLLASAVRSEHRGVLALLHHRGSPVLVAALGGGRVTRAPSTVLTAVRAACGEDVSPDALPALDEMHARALSEIERWCMHADAASVAGSGTPIDARARHAALRRIATITARAPHHRRAMLAPLISRAHGIVMSSFGIGAERMLDELVRSDLGDDAWLRAVDTFGARITSTTTSDVRTSRSVVLAMLLLHDGS